MRVFIWLVWLMAATTLLAASRKIRVNDPALGQLLVQSGATLVGDYGSFQILEAEESIANSLPGDLAQPATDSDVIELHARRLNTRSSEVRALHGPATVFDGKRLQLVHFAGPIRGEWRSALEQSGARIVSYIPQNAYLFYADAAALARVQAWTGSTNAVQWEGEYADDYKVHPGARLTDEQGLPRRPAPDTFAVQLVDDPDANVATLALIEQLKLEPVRHRFRALDFLNLIVRLPPDRLPDLATRPEVVSIQPWEVPQKRDERQNQIVAGNLTGDSPSGPGYLAWLVERGFTQAQFTASDFAVDVTDSGIDNGTTSPGHFGLYLGGDPVLSSRVVYNRLEGTPNVGSTIQGCDGHGTLNSHIIAGFNDLTGFPHADVAGFRYGLGVCPFVKVGSSVIFDPDYYTYPDFANLQSRAYYDGARISANSWGAPVNGAYNSYSQAYDALVRDAQPAGSAFPTAGNQQMVIVFAAGNNGPGAQTVGAPGSGKNVITVGASENVHSHSVANGGNDAAGNDRCLIPDGGADNHNDIAVFSSRGPCADGRLKPDLVAPGTHVTGGVAQSSTNAAGNGAALACFKASGVCALLGAGSLGNPNNFFPLGQQFYTTSSGTSHSTPAVAGACALLRQHFLNQGRIAPSPAMSKAFLVNCARHLTGLSANDNLWSPNQGMGELNLGVALDEVPRVLRDQLAVDKFTATGQTRVFTGRVLDPARPFRVTLAWTDAPGNTTGNAFNNDLDLTVTVGGNTYKGNVFSGAFSVPGGVADFRNNVESVFLPAGVSSNFTVTVTAANINSDGVPNEAPALDQDFALVIYNAEGDPALQAGGYGVLDEGCLPPNGGVDAGETVTVNVALRNLGAGDATNVFATLLSTNGVLFPSDGQNFGILLANGEPVSRPFTFTANTQCGNSLTAVFQIDSSAGPLGLVSQFVSIGAPILTTQAFTNATSLNIPASGSSGMASVYPSSIAVSGIQGAVTKVSLALRGLNHTNPDDLDVLLVGPGGQKLLVMSDCGGSPDINNNTLMFDDGAASALPNSSQLGSGTYRPSNYDSTTDVFPAPAPSAPFGTTLGVFQGQDPNGTWSLYIRDDNNGGTGSLAQGWTLSLTTSNLSCCDSVANLADVHLEQTVLPTHVNVGNEVTLTLTVKNLGPTPASAVMVTNWLPAGLALVSSMSSQGASATNGGSELAFALGPMTNMATATITIQAVAVAAGWLTNLAAAISTTTDPQPGNNSTEAVVAVNALPDLSDTGDQITEEDTATEIIAFIIGDEETPAEDLVLYKSSSNTNLIPPANIAFGGAGSNRTMVITPAPDANGTAVITITVSDGLGSASDSFSLTVNPVNDPPLLAEISNREIFEGETVTFTNLATDVDLPSDSLTFTLLNGPTNAVLDPTDGVFTWTPLETHGPSSNLMFVVVTDGGLPALSATQSFTVVVLETNSAPVLEVIADRVVHAGTVLNFTNSASDPDFPPNVLLFSLDAGKPPGANIESASGVLAWATDDTDANTTNTITVRVTDDGMPNQSDARSFVITVVPRPVLTTIALSNQIVDLTWSAVAGQTYRVQYKLQLEDTNWVDVLPDVTADGSAAASSHPVAPDAQRYYRVLLLP